MDEDVRRVIEGSAAETRRHFDIVAESLRHEIRLVAEGLGRLTERVEEHGDKLDLLTERVDEHGIKLDVLTERVDVLTERVDGNGIKVDVLTERVERLIERVDVISGKDGHDDEDIVH